MSPPAQLLSSGEGGDLSMAASSPASTRVVRSSEDLFSSSSLPPENCPFSHGCPVILSDHDRISSSIDPPSSAPHLSKSENPRASPGYCTSPGRCRPVITSCTTPASSPSFHEDEGGREQEIEGLPVGDAITTLVSPHLGRGASTSSLCHCCPSFSKSEMMMSSSWRGGGHDISHRKCSRASLLPLGCRFSPSYIAEHPLRCIYSELHTLLTVTRLASEALVSTGLPPPLQGSSCHTSILAFGEASCLPPPLSGFVASVESLSSLLHQQLIFLHQGEDEDDDEEEKDEEETRRSSSDDPATGGAEEGSHHQIDWVGPTRSRRGSLSSSLSSINDLDYPSYHQHRTGTSSYRKKKKMSRLLSLQEEHLAPFLFVAADFLPILQSIELQTQSAYPHPTSSAGSHTPGVSWASLINVRPVIAVALASLNKFVGYDLLSPLRCMYSSSLTNQVLEAVLTCAHQQLQQLSGPSTPSLPGTGHVSSSSSSSSSPFSVFGSGGVGLYSAYLGGGSSHNTSANTPLILEEEEVLLHKALSLLSETLKSSSGFFITDEGIWEIFKVCYLTVRQGRISVVLRSYTENLLVQLLLHLFAPPRSLALTDKPRKALLSPLSRLCSPVRDGEDLKEPGTLRKNEDKEERRRSCKETGGGGEESHQDDHRGDEEVESTRREEPVPEGHLHRLNVRRKGERKLQEEEEEEEEVRRRNEEGYFSKSRHRPHGLGSLYMALRFIAFLINHGLPFSSTSSSAPPSLRPDAEGGSGGDTLAASVHSSAEKPTTTTSSSSSNTTKARTPATLPHSHASSAPEGKSTSHPSHDTGGEGGGDPEKPLSVKPSGGKSRGGNTKAVSSSSSLSSREKPFSSSKPTMSSSGRVPQTEAVDSSPSLSSLSSSGGIAEEEEGENEGVYGSSRSINHLEEEKKRCSSSLFSTQVMGDDLYHIRTLEKDLFGMYEESCAGLSSYSFFYHYYNTGSSQNPWSKDEEEFNQEMRSLGVSLLNVVLESSGPALFLKYPPLRHIMTEEISWSLIRSAYMTSSSSLSTLSSNSPHTSGGGTNSSSGHPSSNRYNKDASMLMLSVLLRSVLYLHTYCPPPKTSMIQIELMKSVFFRVLNSPLHVIFFQPSPTLSLLFGGGGGGAPGGSTSSSTSATTALLTSQYHTFLQQLEDKVFPYEYRYLTLESLVELCCSNPNFLLHLFISFDCNIHSDTDACSEILAILSFVVLSPPLPLLPTLQQIQMAASSSSGQSSSGGRSTKKAGPGIGGCFSSLQDAIHMYLPPYHGVYRHPAYVTLYEDGKSCLYSPFDVFRQISRVPFSMFYSYSSSSDADVKSSSTGSALCSPSLLNLDLSAPSFLNFAGMSSPLGRSGGLLFLGSGKSTGGSSSSYAAMMTGDPSMKGGRGNPNMSSTSHSSSGSSIGGGRKGVGAGGGGGAAGLVERRKELSGLSRLALRGLLNVLSTSATRVERMAAKRISSRKKQLSSRNVLHRKMRNSPSLNTEGDSCVCLPTNESNVASDHPLSDQNNNRDVVVAPSQGRVNKTGVDPRDAKMTMMMNREGREEQEKGEEDQGTEMQFILSKERHEEEEERSEDPESEQNERSAAACAICDAMIQSGKYSAVKAFGMVQQLSRLSERRERKRRLALGLMAFNENPKTFIPRLQELRLLPTPTATPRSVAAFLRETRGLDLVKVGEYLAQNKEWNKQVLLHFVGMFSFTNVSLVEALRMLLASFRLPGEAQQIERVMEAFAGEYYQQQPFVSTPQLSKQLEEARLQQQRRQKERSVAVPPSLHDSSSASSTQGGGTGGGKSSKKQGKSKEEEDLRFSIPRWVVSEGAYWRQKDEEISGGGGGIARGGRGGRTRRLQQSRHACREAGKATRSSLSRATGEEEGDGGSLLEFLRQQMRKTRRKDEKNKRRESDEGKQEKRSHQEGDRGDEGGMELLLLDTEEVVKCILRKDQEDHAADYDDEEEENPVRDALTKRLSGFSSTEQQGTASPSPSGYVEFFNRDTVFVLAYSIIILNTDLHNPQVKVKMNIEQFLRNTRDINQGKSLPPFFLTEVYLSIRDDEIRLETSSPTSNPMTVSPTPPSPPPGLSSTTTGGSKGAISGGNDRKQQQQPTSLRLPASSSSSSSGGRSIFSSSYHNFAYYGPTTAAIATSAELSHRSKGGCRKAMTMKKQMPQSFDGCSHLSCSSSSSFYKSADKKRHLYSSSVRGVSDGLWMDDHSKRSVLKCKRKGSDGSVFIPVETPSSYLYSSEELDRLFFFVLWEGGVFDVLRSLFETASDTDVMEAALTGMYLFARIAIALQLTQALNVIIVELAAYVNSTMNAQAQCVLPVLLTILKPKSEEEEQEEFGQDEQPLQEEFLDEEDRKKKKRYEGHMKKAEVEEEQRRDDEDEKEGKSMVLGDDGTHISHGVSETSRRNSFQLMSKNPYPPPSSSFSSSSSLLSSPCSSPSSSMLFPPPLVLPRIFSPADDDSYTFRSPWYLSLDPTRKKQQVNKKKNSLFLSSSSIPGLGGCHWLREEGWAAVIEVFLKLFAVGLLPPSLSTLNDFTDPQGRPLPRLCTLIPPAFIPPPALGKNGGKTGGGSSGGHSKKKGSSTTATSASSSSGKRGWLGDLTNLLFAFGDSDDESDAGGEGETQGNFPSVTLQQQEHLIASFLHADDHDGSDVASFPACLLDNLYLLRCGTPFSFLPTTLSSSFSSLVYTPDLLFSSEGYSNSSLYEDSPPSSQGHFHIPSPKKHPGATKSLSADVSRSGEGRRRRKMKSSSSSESMITAPRKNKPPRSSSQQAPKGGKDITTAIGGEERGEEEIGLQDQRKKYLRDDRSSNMREEDLVEIRRSGSSSMMEKQHTSGRGRGEGERGGEVPREVESGQSHHHHHPHQSTRGGEDEEVDEDEEFLLQQRLEQLAAIPPFFRFKAVLEKLLKIDEVFFQMLRSLHCESALALSVILILHTVPFSSLPTATPTTAPPSPLSSPTPSPSNSVPPVGSPGGHGASGSSSSSSSASSLSSVNQKATHQGSLADGGEAIGGRTGTSHPTSSSVSSSVPSTPASVTSSSTTATTTTTSPVFAHNTSTSSSSSSSSTVVITPYYPYPRLSAFPPAIPTSICLNFLGDPGQYMMMTDGGGNVSTTPSPGTSSSQNRHASSSSGSASQQQIATTSPQGGRGVQGGVMTTAAGTTSPASFVIPSLRDVMHAAALGCGCGISFASSSTTIEPHNRPSFFSSEEYLGGQGGVSRIGREDSLEWTTGALCSSAMSEDIRRFRTVGDRVFALELLGFLMADQGVHIAEEDRLYQLACFNKASRHSSSKRTTTSHLKNRNEGDEGGEIIGADDHRYRELGRASNENNFEEEEEETDTFSPLKVIGERKRSSSHGPQEKYQNETGFTHNEERSLLYPRNRGVWLLCATHLNILIRRYVIGAAAETVEPPLDCILLRYKKQEQRKRYLRLHHHRVFVRDRQTQSTEEVVGGGSSSVEKDGRTTASSSSTATGKRLPDKDRGGVRRGSRGERREKMRGLADREMEERIGHMLSLWGRKLNVETPACLDRDELLFIERLMVISLRLIAEFLPIRSYFLLHKIKTSSTPPPHPAGVSPRCEEHDRVHEYGREEANDRNYTKKDRGGKEDTSSSFAYHDVDEKDGYVNIIRKKENKKKKEKEDRRRRGSCLQSPVEIWIEPAVLQLLALIVHLHPNVYMLQTERITAALQLLRVPPFYLSTLRDSLTIDLLLAILQRTAPLPPFLPPSSLPSSLLRQQQQQLAMNGVRFLGFWLSHRQALLELSKPLHFQTVVQTLLAFSVHTPQLLLLKGSSTASLRHLPGAAAATNPHTPGGLDGGAGGAHHRSSYLSGRGDEGEEGGHSNSSNSGGGGQSTIYAANLKALTLLDELWDHVVKAATMSSPSQHTLVKDIDTEKDERKSHQKEGAEKRNDKDRSPSHGEVSVAWISIQQGAIMWVKVLQGLAIACAFGQKPVRVKALGSLQHQLLRASSPLPPSSSSGGDGGGSTSSVTAHVLGGGDTKSVSSSSSSSSSLYSRVESIIRDSPAVWRIVLHYVLFPLLTFGFEYPYDFQEENGEEGRDRIVSRKVLFSSPSSSVYSGDSSFDSLDVEDEQLHGQDKSGRKVRDSHGVLKKGDEENRISAKKNQIEEEREREDERITSSPVNDDDYDDERPLHHRAKNPSEPYPRESPYTFPSNSKVRRFRIPAAWMAAPLSRRYTAEGAIAALGAEEVLQRRAASASLVSRLFLSHLDLLLQPLVMQHSSSLSPSPSRSPSLSGPSSTSFFPRGFMGFTKADEPQSGIGGPLATHDEDYRSREKDELHSRDDEASTALWYIAREQLLIPEFGGDEEAADMAALRGGLPLLLPPLVQFLELLVEQASAAPVVFCDAFLENLKNTLLVVLTSPAVAQASTEGTVELPPPTAADFDLTTPQSSYNSTSIEHHFEDKNEKKKKNKKTKRRESHSGMTGDDTIKTGTKATAEETPRSRGEGGGGEEAGRDYHGHPRGEGSMPHEGERQREGEDEREKRGGEEERIENKGVVHSSRRCEPTLASMDFALSQLSKSQQLLISIAHQIISPFFPSLMKDLLSIILPTLVPPPPPPPPPAQAASKGERGVATDMGGEEEEGDPRDANGVVDGKTYREDERREDGGGQQQTCEYDGGSAIPGGIERMRNQGDELRDREGELQRPDCTENSHPRPPPPPPPPPPLPSTEEERTKREAPTTNNADSPGGQNGGKSAQNRGSVFGSEQRAEAEKRSRGGREAKDGASAVLDVHSFPVVHDESRCSTGRKGGKENLVNGDSRVILNGRDSEDGPVEQTDQQYESTSKRGGLVRSERQEGRAPASVQHRSDVSSSSHFPSPPVQTRRSWRETIFGAGAAVAAAALGKEVYREECPQPEVSGIDRSQLEDAGMYSGEEDD
ncbi:sec7 domain-containing protein [Cystoisospora suis]|uniref:Sec7 domain-containing protein n=1 Tax=Cystoisospora suis TaxID=483139 RepID=A0A2C6L9W3_9APIC|nr:sec7 domain-containing protein [Cystoisospora suis]